MLGLEASLPPPAAVCFSYEPPVEPEEDAETDLLGLDGLFDDSMWAHAVDAGYIDSEAWSMLSSSGEAGSQTYRSTLSLELIVLVCHPRINFHFVVVVVVELVQ